MNTITNYTITDIENLTENDAFELAEELEEIKGYRVYFVDFPGYSGYSCLVYGDGRQIKWANDYSLYYHPDEPKEKLKDFYIDKLNKRLFTEEEIAAPLKDYFEYENKRRYVMELMPLRRDYQSVFRTGGKSVDKEYPVYLPVAFAYFKEEDRDFTEKINELFNILVQRKHEAEQDYEYMKTAFYYELGNHEYHINTYQGDWDTLSAFGNIEWRGQGAEAREEYFKELNFTDTQIRAFNDARWEFLKDAAEKDWY